MGPIRGIYEYSFDVCKRRKLTRVESALVDCALLVQELGVFLDFWPEVYDEPDVFVEPNSRMSLGMKLWDETRERCGKLGRRRSKA